MATEPVTPWRNNWHFPRRGRQRAGLFAAAAERAEQVVMPLVQHYQVRLVLIQFRLPPDQVVYHAVAWDPGINHLHLVAGPQLAQPELKPSGPGRCVPADRWLKGGRGPDCHEA